MAAKEVNVVVADDGKLFCDSLGALLAQVPMINKVHITYNGKEALDVVKTHNIDLALLDVRMPVMDGLQAAERILKEHPHIKVIGMTSFDEEPTILDLLSVGVHGILLKRSANKTEIATAIKEVMDGKNYFNADIRKVVDKNMHQLNTPSRTRFTPRELDVLRLTAQGKSAKEIAEDLTLSTATVEDYRKEMLRKTKTKNVAELVAFAHLNGII